MKKGILKYILPTSGIIILIVLIFTGARYFVRPAMKTYIVPDEERPWAKQRFEQHISPPRITAPSIPDFFDGIDTSITTGTIEVTHPSVPGINDGSSNYRIFQASAGKTKVADRGSVKLNCYAAFFPEGKVDRVIMNVSEKNEFEFYHTDGREMSDAEIKKILPKGNSSSSHMFRNLPWLRFFVEFSGFDDPDIIGTEIFDADTLCSISGSSAVCPARGKSSFSIGRELEIYHSAPLIFCLDFVEGASETKEIKSVAGTDVSFSNGKCRLLAAVRGDSPGFSSSKIGSKTKMRLSNIASHGNQTSLIFALEPGTETGQFEIEPLTESEESHGYSTSSSGKIMVKTFYFPLDKLKGIRIRYFPRINRVLFPIKPLPVPPKENRNVKNLCDVRIPYAKFERKYEMQNFLENVLEIKISANWSRSSTKKIFPKEYHDVTVGEILDDYIAMYDKDHVKLDSDKWKLSITPKKDWKRRLKDFGRKYLPFLF